MSALSLTLVILHLMPAQSSELRWVRDPTSCQNVLIGQHHDQHSDRETFRIIVISASILRISSSWCFFSRKMEKKMNVKNETLREEING